MRNDPAYGIEVLVKHPDKLAFRSVTGEGLVPKCRKILKDNSFTCSFEEVNADEKVSI